jgi:hypothetical protein
MYVRCRFYVFEDLRKLFVTRYERAQNRSLVDNFHDKGLRLRLRLILLRQFRPTKGVSGAFALAVCQYLKYLSNCCTSKADCVRVGRKILEAKGKSRSTTFVQREKRNFQTAQNGVLPSVAIFAGQPKRNQLYICEDFQWTRLCLGHSLQLFEVPQ